MQHESFTSPEHIAAVRAYRQATNQRLEAKLSGRSIQRTTKPKVVVTSILAALGLGIG
ncbi:MAG: hypothetical protein HRU20_14615 [Pseudomonadales bacterium]|nr:hypothetical protein [Pseudomonadales bacterium]